MTIKSLFCTILSLSLAGNCWGQVGQQLNTLSIGVNGGVALNQVSFSPNISQTFHIAPTMGVTLRYTHEKYYGMICAFQTELNYIQLGWKESIYSASNEPLPDTYSRNLSYLQLPVLASLGFGKLERGFKGYLVAGPQLSYLIGDTEKRSETWTTREVLIEDVAMTIPDRNNNVFQQYGMEVQNKFEYGIVAGLGCELSTRIGHFLVEGRYYMGLSNIFAATKSDVFSRSANNTITAKVTYLFDLFH